MSSYATTLGEMPVTRVRSSETADKVFLGLIGFAACFQTVVVIEPAPFDVAIIGLFIFGLLLGKLSFRKVSPYPLLMLAGFAVMNLVSMKNAYDPSRALFYLAITLYLILSWIFYVGLIGYYGSRATNVLMIGYSIAGLSAAALGILGVFHLIPFSDQFVLYGGRARGLFKDCNVYGPYFIPMALIGLAGVLRGGRGLVIRLGSFALFVVSSVATLLSYSRAAWIAYAIAVAVFFGLDILVSNGINGAIKKIIAIAGICAVAGALFMALMTIPAVSEMMAARMGGRQGHAALQRYDVIERQGAHDKAMQSAFDRPLGIGPGQSELEFMMATHSAYLRVLSENGIPALFFFLSFIALSFFRSLRQTFASPEGFSRDVYMIVAACIVGHLVNSSVIDTVHWRHIWLLCALPWGPLGRKV